MVSPSSFRQYSYFHQLIFVYLQAIRASIEFMLLFVCVMFPYYNLSFNENLFSADTHELYSNMGYGFNIHADFHSIHSVLTCEHTQSILNEAIQLIRLDTKFERNDNNDDNVLPILCCFDILRTFILQLTFYRGVLIDFCHSYNVIFYFTFEWIRVTYPKKLMKKKNCTEDDLPILSNSIDIPESR